MADTFEAWSRDPEALKATIAKQPSTLDVATESLRVQRPFLEHTAAFSRDLNAAASELPGTLPPLNRALEIGTPVTRRSVELNKDLQGAMDALRKLSEAPTTLGALRGLTDTENTLQPQLRYLGPYVTVCNYWNMFWTFTAEHFTAPDATGGSERALLNSAASQDDGIGSQGANEFANGKNTAAQQRRRPAVPAQQLLRRRRRRRAARPTARSASRATCTRPTRTTRRRTSTTSALGRPPVPGQADRPELQASSTATATASASNRDTRAARRDVHLAPAAAAASTRPLPDRPEGIAGMRRKHKTGPSNFAVGAIVLLVAVHRDLPGLHEVDPVPPPLRDPRGLPDGEQHQAELVRADRRRQRRQGHRRSTASRATRTPRA